MSHGRFCWNDLMTTDLEAAKAFYAALMGWTLDVDETHRGPYVLFHDGQRHAGGMMTLDAGFPMPSHWLPYVTVKDVGETLAQVRALGGTVHHGPFRVPEVGEMAVIADPQGAVLNVIDLDQEDPEPERRPLPGEFCWYSVSTPDPEGAKAFYTAVFGWEARATDVGGGNIQETFFRGGMPIAGMAPPQGPQPFWGTAVVAVGGLDAAFAKAQALGATPIMPPMALGTMGRLAIIQGPTGEVLTLFEALD
ncbi:MAG: VOC family protein [Alphaproteobacteria bacterium]|nr:VOC family protein [Alphaproteobacteria bacterium]MCB9796852.1 VOC family protein [Alphaproteobacteria bacterium]